MQDQKRYQKLLSQMEKEDADFFDYANEVLNECKVGGRPVYPIQKTIHVRFPGLSVFWNHSIFDYYLMQLTLTITGVP